MNIDIVLFAHRDWIKLKKHPQPCDTPTISLSPAFNLRFNHSPPSEGLGEARGGHKKSHQISLRWLGVLQLIRHYL
jgi:hypothetical protein